VRLAGVLSARAHAGATAEEAPEVLRLGQRALRPRARDLERVLLADLGELMRDPLAEVERDALRMVDEEANGSTVDDLGGEDLHLGLGGRESRLDLLLYGTAHS